jgi:hypothetical protein
MALESLQPFLDHSSRPQRFKPTQHLSIARILFDELVDATPVVGEILDLSRDGIKIALAVSQPVEVDQTCHLLVGRPDGACHRLLGHVRWVERNPYITVLGLALRDAGGGSQQPSP